MMHTEKIATCCYCGSRTILQLTARSGHELACGSCGAPLHEMKPMRLDRGAGPKSRAGGDIHRPSRGKSKKKQKKRRSRQFWDMLEDVADVIDDILD